MLDVETELKLQILNHLLLGTPASSLRKILLESGLGNDIIGNGIEGELCQSTFAIGMKGLSKDDVRKVEELIETTFKNLAEEGFALDAVEASVNTIEFSLRENNSGSFPRGLSLMLCSINKWIYDRDPFEPLLYEEPLLNLKSYISREGPKVVFSPLIEKFFLNNSHRVTVEMEPDPDKASRDEADQNELLKKTKASMTEEEVVELARATKELRLKQETPDSPEALRCIPKLSLEDILKKPTHIPTTIEDVDGVKVLKHNLFTNNIVYLEVVFDMSSLKQELQLSWYHCSVNLCWRWEQKIWILYSLTISSEERPEESIFTPLYLLKMAKTRIYVPISLFVEKPCRNRWRTYST